MMHLFTYGTLCVPEVMQAVCGNTFETAPATLVGYHRRLIHDRPFPGMTVGKHALDEAKSSEQKIEVVDGTLHFEIDHESWQRLDHFESDIYDRLEVAVQTANGPTKAQAYILPKRHAHLLSDIPWNLETFIERDLPTYL